MCLCTRTTFDNGFKGVHGEIGCFWTVFILLVLVSLDSLIIFFFVLCLEINSSGKCQKDTANYSDKHWTWHKFMMLCTVFHEFGLFLFIAVSSVTLVKHSIHFQQQRKESARIVWSPQLGRSTAMATTQFPQHVPFCWAEPEAFPRWVQCFTPTCNLSREVLQKCLGVDTVYLIYFCLKMYNINNTWNLLSTGAVVQSVETVIEKRE